MLAREPTPAPMARSSTASVRTPHRRDPVGRILSIGDEIVLGRIVDTNAAQVARWMTDHGLVVDQVRQVGDGEAAIREAMRDCAEGASLVVATGGLGPTEDDRTRHALAGAMGVALVEHAASLRMVRSYFDRSGRAMPEVNRRQALLPAGARMLDNDRGTAPGMLGRIGGAWLACMPGVPHEMVAMLARLGPRLGRLLPGLRPPTVGEVWFSGIGESGAQQLIPGLLTERDPQVGITVNELGHITVRVVGKPRAVRARVRELEAALRAYLLPEPGLAPSVVAALLAKKATITTAESCTCGHLAAAIGAIPGASAVLRQGVVAYHAAVKTAALGVDPMLIAAHGVVSEAVARAMAEGARASARAEIAAATTGIAGPDGGTSEIPVGTVWVAVADARGSQARRHQVRGERQLVQRRGTAYALQLVWEQLKSW